MKSVLTTKQRLPTGTSGAVAAPPASQSAGRLETADQLLSASEAARNLGITVTTLYDWLGRSKIGELMIRGQLVTIDYFQGGSQGQGRIQIEAGEVARLRELMRVTPINRPIRRPSQPSRSFPGITVPLGHPTKR